MSQCSQCIIKDLNALKVFDKESLIRISNCKTSSVIKKGEHLFEEGHVLAGIFCIKEGICKVSKLSDNGRSHIVKLVSKGELLGQRSLLSDEPSNLTATALEDMQVCFVPKAEVMNHFVNNSNFALEVLRTISDDLKEADNGLVNMAQKTVRERLAHTLLYLQDNFGKDADNNLRIQLSREDLASIVGTAIESCIRLLSDFKKEGLIDLKGKKIAIINERDLRRMR